MKNNGLKAFVAMGLVGSMAAVAWADPAVINVTGATLLQNFVRSPASTRDFIDADHDGITLDQNLGIRQQLAPDLSLPASGSFPASAKWLVHYRAVGSVNGLKELLRNGRTYFHGNATAPLGFPVAAVGATDGAYFNRTLFTQGGIAAGPGAGSYNAANPGGFPWLTTEPASGVAPTPVFPGGAGNGMRADIAPLDVPTRWAVTQAGTPGVGRKPAQNGYGMNSAPTRRKDGVATAFGDSATQPGTYWSRLADRGTAVLNGPGVVGNANTLYDTSLAYAPIAPIANVGTGLQQIKMTELQHLYVTGRLPSGENLTAITRDAGSGTRNGFCNSIRIDPSYGAGENIGVESAATNETQPGAAYSPSNKAGSGTLETTVRYTRLGVGYTGAERTPALMGANNRAELLGVMNDVLGGTVYVRPTAANVISNSTVNTWRIAGPAQFVTFGDPLAEPLSEGGEANGNPRLLNPAAAAYVNNIRKSVISFTGNAGTSINDAFSPGEAAATFFILPAGVEYVPDAADKNNNGDVLEWVANLDLNTALRDWELANSTYGLSANVPLFASFGTGSTGQAPQRTTGVTYSDGVVNGGNYKNQAGVNVSFNANLNVRNKLSGDFNNDGLRNVNDVPGMIAAWRDRAGLGAWDGVDVNGGASDTSAVIEIIGDFNNDGSFDSKDVRYFADGLAMTVGGTPALNRKAGFIAVDNAAAAQGGPAALNFFGTTKATPAAYAAGDSRGDVAGARVTTDTLGNAVTPYFKATPGYTPTGNDGAVNGWDITYVYKQFKNNPRVTDGALNWSNLAESEGADLSADMNGDLIIDQNDVVELVQVILGTTMGDVNLDGVQNSADEAIIIANMGMTNAAWQNGDLDGDGAVTGLDLSVYNNVVRCGQADVGQQGGLIGYDGLLDNNDFIAFIELFFNQSPVADFGQQGGEAGADGLFDNNDFIVFIEKFFNGCN